MLRTLCNRPYAKVGGLISPKNLSFPTRQLYLRRYSFQNVRLETLPSALSSVQISKTLVRASSFSLFTSVRSYSVDSQQNGPEKTENAENKPLLGKLKDIPLKEDLFNIPNILTLSRLAASPFIGYLIYQQHYTAALIGFAITGFTDMLDGYIARKWDMKTFVGSIIDPMADKTLMTILTVTLASQNLIPMPLAVLILGRDVGLVISSFYYRYISLPPPKTLTRYFDFTLPSAEVRPTQISKVNTALQLLLMGASLAGPVFGFSESVALTALQYTVGVTTVLSGASYIYSKDAVRILNQPNK
ncbi:hypothetical protein K493DRAFT_90388 [Basidiobolus meristosporus CBS 931.73]|uniref:Cardiolipin synthase n=1 Tax=Basidiobolus meristosporus CBS 931.73 TaxID=1314790 RepID=A0A1Y1XB28_9FUNG|nr:hypothetical protein K493DRAFT_90388 [Basidiobolus meristosporus CBS 931.73]|eukprot:ORX82962.1 hypothetical protein K493DRAFT_90388 [Basidiobolus meristosporus CBS 931.73]